MPSRPWARRSSRGAPNLRGNQILRRVRCLLDGVAMPVPRRSTEPGRPRHRQESCARRTGCFHTAPNHGYARANDWKSSRCANLVEESKYHSAKAPQTPDATRTRNTAAVTVDNRNNASSDVTATPALLKSHLKAASAPKRWDRRRRRASERRHRVIMFV